MLTGKQKRHLRAMAHSFRPVFQVGKEGIGENQLNSINDYLEIHELCKISILQNCMLDTNDCKEIFESVGFEVVQTIGRVVVLYKESTQLEKKDKIRLP